ncbi:hypothetical protein [Sutcliffiella cohnii]|uniref:hypothetical protein n=1 Tax=Sutcliffiella cohnii TaxID=33932 RepID=UPI002E1CDEC1|nr:hypothetical protein [Sutcliffiella cohnii]
MFTLNEENNHSHKVEKRLELQKHYISVPFKAVLNRDILRVKYFIRNLEVSEYNRKLRNNIGVRLFGYPMRDGEMEFEIYEIQMWVKELFEECPYLFYYLAEDLEIARNLFLCLANINGVYKCGDEVSKIEFIKSETRPIANKIREEALKHELKLHKQNSKELREMLDRTLSPF